MRSRNPEALGREKDEEAAKIRQDAEKLEAEVLPPHPRAIQYGFRTPVPIVF